MRKIKVYDQLSVYAQRMLNLMHDPAWFGLGSDIWENEDGWALLHNDEFLLYRDKEQLDYKLSRMLVDFVAKQIKIVDSVDEISDIAEYLVI